MKIAILHLSDIHLATAGTNMVLKRREKIFDAVKNPLLTVDESFLVVTGDLTNSGHEDEYDLGRALLDHFRESIEEYTKKRCRIIVIPGNHDCYFDEAKQSAREHILKGLEQEEYVNVDKYSLDLCTEPQDNYFSFISISGYNIGDELLHDHKLLTSIKFVRGDYSFIFHCYNTSWHSRKKELQGRMSLPVKQFDRKAFRQKANVIISLIHHPFNWQNAGSGRDARVHLENTSDFVLSGHEHAKEQYIRKSDSETTYYIESGALQDSGNSAISEFGLMVIDLEKKEFCFDNYELTNAGDRYINVSKRAMEPLLRSKQLTTRELEVTDRFYYGFLQDPGSKFLHSQTDRLRLGDIFVYPNLRRIYDVRDVQPKEVETLSADRVMADLDHDRLRVILVGDEGSGKTTFCKFMFTHFWHEGFVPVYLSCNDVNVKASTDNFVRNVNASLSEQYDNMKEEIASQLDRKKIIVILEDFELLKGSSEAKAKFVHGINKVFIHIVITGKAQLLFEPITTTNKEFVDAYQDYVQFQITEFGRDLRYKLIDKWNKIGRVDEIEPNEIRRMNDATMAKMDSIIGKNFLPPYPIYLLTIIQSLETVAAANPDYSLQGYYYDYLISDSMNKAISDKEALSFYYNFVSEYAYFLFSEKIKMRPMSKESFEKFYAAYRDKYQINVSVESVIGNLTKAKIIVYDENKNISLAYNYIYYFFIARYLNSRIHLEETRTQIKYMCGKMYRDEYANVILFLVHLSRDPLILNEVQQVARSLFAGLPICRLENDVDRINGMIENLPKQVVELIDIDKAREMEFEHQEEMEAEAKKSSAAVQAGEAETEDEEIPQDIISQIFFAFKAIDILGQVTKKHWGDLPGPQKLELAEETYKLGLRTLHCYLQVLGQSGEVLAEHIRSLVLSKQIKDRDKIAQFSKNFTFRMSFMASFGIIKRISNAIGYSKLNATFAELVEKMRCPSVELIDLSIKLDHFPGFPMDDIMRLKESTKKKWLAWMILTNLVTNYLYLFDTGQKTKQQLESLLGITVKQSLRIDNTSQVKRS